MYCVKAAFSNAILYFYLYNSWSWWISCPNYNRKLKSVTTSIFHIFWGPWTHLMVLLTIY